jgi:dTMP kinase
MEALLRLHESACQGMWPELTVYLDVPLDVAASRQQAQQLPLDRLEGAPESFHAAVRDAYEDLTSRFAHRFIRVDATRPPLLVARDIYEAVRLRLRLRDGAAVTAAERP